MATSLGGDGEGAEAGWVPDLFGSHTSDLAGDAPEVGDDLDRAFAALGLQGVYKAARWHSFEAAFVKGRTGTLCSKRM